MKKNSTTIFSFLLLFIVALTVIIIRLRFLHLPLDRDEGEYAYAGWRMIHGGIPFLDYYNMKMPGIYALYGLLFRVFSPTVASVRLGLLLFNIANAGLMFQLGKQLGNIRMGTYSCICYLIFSLQLEFQGMNAYAENFAIFFVLAGILLLLNAWSKKKNFYFLFSGLMLGTAFLMKQSSFAFIPFAFVIIVIEVIKERKKLRTLVQNTGLTALGSLLPLLITTAILWHFGALHNFRLFAFQYAQEYISYASWHDGVNNCLAVLKTAINPNPFLWMLIPLSLIFMLVSKRSNFRLFKILLLIFSFISVSAGYYFRPHYFQLLVPAISFLAATSLCSWEDLSLKKNWRTQSLSITFLSIAAFYFFFNQRAYFFSSDEQTFIRKKFGFDLFNAVEKAGDFIAQHSKPNATVAIFGAEPEIWFYAKRKAASGYMYIYPLLEKHKFADIMLAQYFDETLKSKPDILVYTSVEGTWYSAEDRHQKIFDWYKSYRDSSFKRIALIDMPDNSATSYYWSQDTAIHPLNEENYIEIDERK